VWESLKLLEALERGTLEKAKSFIKLPISASERKRMTNEKILTSLKKLGVATQDEVGELKRRIEELESALAAKSSSSRAVRAESAQATEGAIPQS
jgi:polyhydroxyalkanoate synthesis regulator phasin